MNFFSNSAMTVRSLALIGITGLWAFQSQLFAETADQQPAWWKDGNPPIIKLNAPQSNKAISNIGQAKWMVKEALRALRENGHESLASAIEADLASPPPIFDVNAIPDAANRDAAWFAKQKTPLQLGYLKALAKPFYDRLNELDKNWVLGQLNTNGLTTQGTHYWTVTGNTNYTDEGHYPWNPATPVAENKTPATIGQLKALFALRFGTITQSGDSDNDGIADIFEQQIVDSDSEDEITSIIEVIGEDDFDGDGYTNFREYQLGSDPTSKYNALNSVMLSHWPLNEKSGSQVYNNVASGSSGVILGDSTRSDSGMVGGYTQLDSSTAHVKFDTEQLKLGKNNKDFSVQFWINPTSHTSSWRNIIHKGATNQQRTFSMWFRPNSNRLHYVVSDGSSQYGLSMDSSVNLTPNIWALVTYVKQGDQSILYINGQEDSRRTLPEPVVSNNGPLYLGDDPWYDGSIAGFSDLRIFDIALLPNEVSRFYSSVTDKDLDTDGDGLKNGFEVENRLDPNSADENNNGIIDGQDDFDGDTWVNASEQIAGTSIFEYDTDSDGIPDYLDSSPLTPDLVSQGSVSFVVLTPLD